MISLGNVCRWLGQQAESLGVEIFPGFAAAEVLYHDDGSVKGVATGDMGVGKDGKPTDAYQPGMELHAKYTFFAEGCRGHLGKQLQERFKLRDGADPQVYGIGLKELWEIKPEKHQPGLVIHTAGWPLDSDTYGGSFLYHMENNLVAIGYVVGLAYTNPYLSPYEEFQRYKTHPAIRAFLEGGKRIAYGARAITAGGLQSLPKLIFPGGCLIGDDAGFLNASRIKGSHCAIKSGMLAAEAAFEAVQAGRASDELATYPESFEELAVRRAAPRAQLQAVDEQGALHRLADVRHRPGAVRRARAMDAASPPRRSRDAEAENRGAADRLSQARRRDHLRPAVVGVHLQYQSQRRPALPPDAEGRVGAGQRQSRVIRRAGAALLPGRGLRNRARCRRANPRLQINAQNCVHCKTCDIKDPTQNIVWVTPEGGGGPNYPNM